MKGHLIQLHALGLIFDKKPVSVKSQVKASISRILLGDEVSRSCRHDTMRKLKVYLDYTPLGRDIVLCLKRRTTY